MNKRVPSLDVFVNERKEALIKEGISEKTLNEVSHNLYKYLKDLDDTANKANLDPEFVKQLYTMLRGITDVLYSR